MGDMSTAETIPLAPAPLESDGTITPLSPPLNAEINPAEINPTTGEAIHKAPIRPPDTGRPQPEEEIHPEITEAQLRQVWGTWGKEEESALGLLWSAWKNKEYNEESEVARKAFAKNLSLVKGREIKPDDPLVVKEMKAVNSALDIIAKASKGRKISDVSGELFEVLDKNGKPTGEKVKVQQAVKPIIDELKRMSQEKTQPEVGKEPEATQRAKSSQKILGVLEDWLIPYKTGEYFIATSEKAKRDHEVKIAREDAVSLGWDTLDAHLKGIGKKGIRNDKGQIDMELVTRLVKELDPANITSLGRLTVFLVAHAKAKDAKSANTFLPTLIHKELTGLISGDFAAKNQQLKAKVDGLSKIFDLFLKTEDPFRPTKLNELQKNLKALIDHTISEGGYDPENRQMGVDQFTKIITIAFLIQDKVALDAQGRAFITPEPEAKKGELTLKETLSQMESTGALTPFEKQLVLNLAGQKAAGKIFQALGFTPEVLEKLTDKDCAQYFATEAVTVLKNRLGDSLPEEKAEEYKVILQEIFEQGIAHYDKKFNLGSWFKMLGMLALILIGPASQLLDLGVEKESSGGGGQPG